MAYASATFADARSFGGPAFAIGERRRATFNPLLIAFATIAGTCAMGVAAIFAAAWMVGAVLSTHPGFHGRTPLAPELTVLAGPRRIAGTAQFAGSAPALTPTNAYARDMALQAELHQAELHRAIAAARAVPLPPKRVIARADTVPPPHSWSPPESPAKHEVAHAPALTQIAKLTPVPVPAAAPAQPAPPPKRAPIAAGKVPLPPWRPSDAPPVAVAHEVARATPAPAMPPLVTGSLPPPASEKPLTVQQALNGSIAMPGPRSRVAVYDIAAHTVFLPNGERLEAHSGLGHRLDDPHYVDERRRGPTPPNIYDLTLRGHLFHGVRAIRLNPVDDDKMYGRDGMLAHTYMLGPTGQSFGCVSFKQYPKFLQAFLSGEIDRLVVVPHLKTEPPRTADARRRHGNHYAFNAR